MTGLSDEKESIEYSPEKFEQVAMRLASNLMELDRNGLGDLANVLTGSLVITKDTGGCAIRTRKKCSCRGSYGCHRTTA